MKLKFDKYVITTDSLNFIINTEETIKKSKYPEKIGTTKLTPWKYFSTIDGVLKDLGMQMVRDYDELDVIIAKLNELQESAERLADVMTIEMPEKLKKRRA